MNKNCEEYFKEYLNPHYPYENVWKLYEIVWKLGR